MGLQNPFRATVLVWMILAEFSIASAQQKPQWIPGQIGLNAGVTASPGFTYANITINYDAGAFNGPKGNAVPVIGSYNVWAVENVFIFAPETKFLGGHLGFQALLTPASGSLVADLNIEGVPNLGAAGGGGGLADLWLQPFTLGWKFKRLDFQVGDVRVTGKYWVPAIRT